VHRLKTVGALASLAVAAAVISACGSSASPSASSTTTSSASAGKPAGAAKTKITDWADPRPAAWTSKFPLFAPVATGDGSLAAAQSNGLKICAETDLKPYVYTDTSGTVIGAEVDMAHWMASYLGISSVSYVNIPFDSLIPALQAGKCTMVMSSISLNATRAAAPGIKYTVPYYWTAYDYLTVRKDSSIKTFGDLKGKSIGSLAGSIDATTAQNEINSAGGGVTLHLYPNVSLCFLAAHNGTTAGCFIDSATTVYGLKQYGDLVRLPTKYSYASADSAKEDASNPYVYDAVSTITSSKAGDLNLALSIALNALRTSGAEHSIAEKWSLGDVIDPPDVASYEFLRGQS
jgi:ABC-type amino acid transport substrate-binding protein